MRSSPEGSWSGGQKLNGPRTITANGRQKIEGTAAGGLETAAARAGGWRHCRGEDSRTSSPRHGPASTVAPRHGLAATATGAELAGTKPTLVVVELLGPPRRQHPGAHPFAIHPHRQRPRSPWPSHHHSAGSWSASGADHQLQVEGGGISSRRLQGEALGMELKGRHPRLADAASVLGHALLAEVPLAPEGLHQLTQLGWRTDDRLFSAHAHSNSE